MSLLRASSSTLRTLRSSLHRRHLAIIPTVKTAPDTSAIDFPAPSHVSLSATAADLASQLSDFYSNPSSMIELSEEQRGIMHAEIVKKVEALPDSNVTTAWTAANVVVPEKITIGENPYFDVYKSLREQGKLD